MRAIGFFPSFLLAAFAAAADAPPPFEKCDWSNREYAERLVRDSEADINAITEAGFCADCEKEMKGAEGRQEGFIKMITEFMKRDLPPECFLASAARSVNKEAGKTAYYYCVSPTIKENSHYMTPVTDHKGKKRVIYTRAPCISESYVMMTFRAFHSMAFCFGFSPLEKKRIFALFNHESSFILNQKSPRGARCYGQMSDVTVNEVNKRIYLSGNREPSLRSQIYNEALEKCPNLAEKVNIHDSSRPDGRQKTDRSFKSESRREMNCRVTQHAPTCLFYSMYNIKINLGQIGAVLRSRPDLPQNMDIPERMQRHFPLPIRLNEALVIKGKFKEGGEGAKSSYKGGKAVYREFVVRDALQLYGILYDSKTGKMRRGYNPKDLKIEKAPVYEIDENTKWSLAYLAHNGGLTMTKDKLKTFIERGKNSFASGDLCEDGKNSKEEECSSRRARELRARIKKGRPLPFDMKDFHDLLKEEKVSQEAREFLSKIRQDADYLNDEDADKIKPLSRHLRRLSADTRPEKYKKKKENGKIKIVLPEISPERMAQIKSFTESIKGKCVDTDMLLSP